MMKTLSMVIQVLVIALLSGCFSGQTGDSSPSEQPSGAVASSTAFNKEASIKAFSTTVYPLTSQRCVECHSPEAALRQKPFHSHPEYEIAHDEILEASAVNFSDIPKSMIVLRLRESRHECWSDDCDADADELQAAIEAWASQMDAATLVQVSEQNSVVQDPSEVETLPIPISEELNFDREASMLAFRETVHKITLERCVDCHRPNGITAQQAPYHAHEDFSIAHDAVVDTARVNFVDTSKSRIVLRLKDDNHYCWSDNCSADADEMLAAIDAWASQVDTTGVATLKGHKTQPLAIADADIRLPETINGSIVMQAESATLSGRFKTKQNSEASDFLYVGTDYPPVHPVEGTPRVPSVNFRGQGCQPPTSEDLQNTVTGSYRIQEMARHVDQRGYRYYSQQLQVRFIRPHLREAFREAILRGESGTQLERFFLTTDAPIDSADFNGVLDGDPITSNVVRVLPEFATKKFFDRTLHGGSAEAYRDFFAPKYGASGLDYWSAMDDEIRENLADSLKRGSLYDQVIAQYRRWFFDRKGRNGDWIAKRRIVNVPFTLRTLLDSEGARFEARNINVSQRFYDYYLGGLTRENALDMVGGMPRIDAYVYYFIDPSNRAFGNVNQFHRLSDGTARRDSFRLARGNVNLDLASFYSGSDESDPRTFRINNYADIIKPIFVANNCIQCHADGSNRPQFAQNNNDAAYDAAASVRNFFNVNDPTQARPVQRMLEERHNCSSAENCDMIGLTLQNALTDWNSKNREDMLAVQDSQDTGMVALSVQERTPGRANFKVRVTEAGMYNIWLKLRSAQNDANSFFVRVLDAEGNSVNGVGDGDGSNASASCKRFEYTTNGDWDWYTASINNVKDRIQWNLGVGEYSIEVVEREVGAELDMIAISTNPEFNPAKKLVDESNIQSSNPKILVYDLIDSIGQPGRFEIEVIENKPMGAYTFRNPRIQGVNSNIRYSNIKILVNDQYELSNSTYTKLHRVVDGQDSGILTRSSLIALMGMGESADLFSFVFGDLALIDQPVEPLENDIPEPVQGKECLNLDLFAKSVMPILNNFKLMLKEDYEAYTADQFPGRSGRDVSNPVIYNCTTCHNEEHPYFKMTTFADGLAPGQPVPQDGLETLCSQALSRVDFGSYERSLLLRGLNGTFNHPKLHFIQKAELSGEGNQRAFTTSTVDASGYDSAFIGLRFDKWSANDLDLDNYQGQRRDFLERYVGRYKTISYVRYINPFSVNDGVIMADNDVILNPGTTFEELEAMGGQNLYVVTDPIDELIAFDDLSQDEKRNTLNRDPIDSGGPWMIKDACVGEGFNNMDGILTDPCNGGVNVTTGFENLKQIYRESIINWMKEERQSYILKNNG